MTSCRNGKPWFFPRPRGPRPAARRATGVIVALAAVFPLGGCTEIPRASTEKNDLSSMRVVEIRITDSRSGTVRATYQAYVAEETQATLLGLMNVTAEELPPDRGMIFVFGYDDPRSFWMRNTIIPLDIAYIRSDGTIVKTYTMEPLDEGGYPSIEPVRFVLEVRGGQFAQWGIREDDHVEIPAELFDR